VTKKEEAWSLFLATRVAGMFVDAAVMAGAYLAAFALRLDFQEPQWGWRAVAQSFVVVWAVQQAALFLTGCYRLTWRRTGALDVPRYVLAVIASAVALTLMRFLLPSLAHAYIRPPYSITLINAVLVAVGVIGVRWLWRLAWDARRQRELLLNRDERRMDSADVVALFAGKRVMVTGAGGSIGSELVRQIARCAPAEILLVERGENALYEIDRALRSRFPSVKAVPEMVDISDAPRMRAIFAAHRPEIVLHAAAYKHVPMVEANPREGIRNNVLATRVLGEMALEAGVERFVMISTDKAVRPAGVMGMTKRMAEIALLGLNGGATRFSGVRFGNVLGASGSVVPLFKEQIARGGPVTVTHPDMKRYFMTVQEAVGLVLEAAALAKGGEIFVLDMGEPVAIVDLAEQMIRRAGLRPYVDLPIIFTGIRPGEKLFEELDVSEKGAFRTGHARIFIRRENDARPDVPALIAAAERLVRDPPPAAEAAARVKELLRT
jgi:FlaA1/EpsC-like NDP-sugar epimerase